MPAPTNNLPGVNVTLNDYGLRLAPPDAGPKVTLIGLASNPALPVNEPLQIVNSESAIDALFFASHGGVFTGGAGQKWPSDLSLGVEEAFAAGATNVEVMITARVTGANTHYVSGYSAASGYLDLSGTYEALLNTSVDVVALCGFYMDEPDVTGGSIGAGESYNYGKQLADFCFQATSNANSAIGVIGMMPVLRREAQVKFSSTENNSALAVRPEDGIFGGYTGAFRTQDWKFDTPSLSSVTNWVKWLDLTKLVHFMTGVVPSGTTIAGGGGLSYTGQPYTNSLLYSYLLGSELNGTSVDTVNSTYIANWQARDEDRALSIDSKGNKIDAGQYINVVASPLRAFSSQAKRLASYWTKNVASNSYNTDGAAAYAGRITSLLPHYGMTNKVVPGVGPARDLGRKLADRLLGRRLVCFLIRDPGFVVARGITGAANAGRYAKSDYTSLTVVRIVHAIVDSVRGVSEKYIGDTATPQTRNAMDQEIRSNLSNFKEQGAILDFEFSITATPDQNALGEADVNMTIVPAGELVKLNLTVNLTKTLN